MMLAMRKRNKDYPNANTSAIMDFLYPRFRARQYYYDDI